MEYTDFLQLVLSRQSDRAYDKERPVEAEKLERILGVGSHTNVCKEVIGGEGENLN